MSIVPQTKLKSDSDDWAVAIIDNFVMSGGFGRTSSMQTAHEQFMLLVNDSSKTDRWGQRRDALAIWCLICIELDIPTPEDLVGFVRLAEAESQFWIVRLAFCLTNYRFKHAALNREKDDQGVDLIPFDEYCVAEAKLFRVITLAAEPSGEDFFSKSVLHFEDYLKLCGSGSVTNVPKLNRTYALLRHLANLGSSEAEYILGLLGDQNDEWLDRASEAGLILASYSLGCRNLEDDPRRALEYFTRTTQNKADEYLDKHYSNVKNLFDANTTYHDFEVTDEDELTLSNLVDNACAEISKIRMHLDTSDKYSDSPCDSLQIRADAELESKVDAQLKLRHWIGLSREIEEQYRIVVRCKLRLEGSKGGGWPECISSLMVESAKLYEAVFKFMLVKFPIQNKNHRDRKITMENSGGVPPQVPCEEFFNERSKYVVYVDECGNKRGLNEFIDKQYKFNNSLKIVDWAAVTRLIWNEVPSAVMINPSPLRCIVCANVLSSYRDSQHPMRIIGANLLDLETAFRLYRERNSHAHYTGWVRVSRVDANSYSEDVLNWADQVMIHCTTPATR